MFTYYNTQYVLNKDTLEDRAYPLKYKEVFKDISQSFFFGDYWITPLVDTKKLTNSSSDEIGIYRYWYYKNSF